MTDRDALRARLRIPSDRLDAINGFLLDPGAQVVTICSTCGEVWNTRADQCQSRRGTQTAKPADPTAEQGSPYLEQVEWLIAQRSAGAFVSEGSIEDRAGERADTCIQG